MQPVVMSRDHQKFLEISNPGVDNPLYQAAASGRYDEVCRLMQTGEVKTEGAFLVAVQNGHYAIVQYLSAQPTINVNEKDNNGRSAFFHAVCSTNQAMQKMIMMLAACSAVDIWQEDKDGVAPLTAAAIYSNGPMMEFLFTKDPVTKQFRPFVVMRTHLESEHSYEKPAQSCIPLLEAILAAVKAENFSTLAAMMFKRDCAGWVNYAPSGEYAQSLFNQLHADGADEWSKEYKLNIIYRFLGGEHTPVQNDRILHNGRKEPDYPSPTPQINRCTRIAETACCLITSFDC